MVPILNQQNKLDLICLSVVFGSLWIIYMFSAMLLNVFECTISEVDKIYGWQRNRKWPLCNTSNLSIFYMLNSCRIFPLLILKESRSEGLFEHRPSIGYAYNERAEGAQNVVTVWSHLHGNMPNESIYYCRLIWCSCLWVRQKSNRHLIRHVRLISLYTLRGCINVTAPVR